MTSFKNVFFFQLFIIELYLIAMNSAVDLMANVKRQNAGIKILDIHNYKCLQLRKLINIEN